jgi:ABC-type branched-subunit amino acid transport system substrate-binding protein
VAERARPRVAVVGPFSGPRAAWGRLLTDARWQVGTAVDWQQFDDRGDPVRAERAAEQIVRDGGYAAVLGHFNSRGARAALPRYRSAGLACLLPLATDPGLTALAPGLVLRWCATDQAQAAALVGTLAAAGHRTVGVLTDGSLQMKGLTGLLLAAAPPGMTARPLPVGLTPDQETSAVVVVAAHYRAAALARELRARGFTGQFAFTDDCAVAEFADLAGGAAAGAVVSVQPGGAPSRVLAATAALAGALAGDPTATGTRLVAAVRAHTRAEFDPLGELTSEGWSVRPLAAVR